MKKKIYILIFTFLISDVNAAESLKYYLNKAINNNLQLNAERKKLESVKQDKNISRSEFLPSITLSGDQTSTTSTNITNQSGSILSDTNLDTESKSISLEQKIFAGFKGVNTFKKSELETEKAKLELKEVRLQTIRDAAFAFYDLIYKSNNEKFNISNVKLFERQVEFDSARLQKGEITLVDLAQSESSLAGANADLIKAKTDLLSSQRNFERVIGKKSPKVENLDERLTLELPGSLKSSQELANLNNISLLISKLNYQISIKDLNIERARLSPSASIKFSKSETKDFSSTIDEKDEETVEASISWPIIKGGENISSIKKFSYKKQQAKLILQDTENEITSKSSNFWSNYVSSKSVLEATRAQLKAAEIANEGITLEYDSGNTRTTLEVIQSRSLLLDARIAFAKAKRDFMVSQFELAKHIGILSLKTIK